MQTREDTLQYLLVLLILEGDSKISNYYGALTETRPLSLLCLCHHDLCFQPESGAES